MLTEFDRSDADGMAAVVKLQDLLAEFNGLDADEVAAKLRAEGVKGRRNKPRHCPIANWLKSRGLEHVHVSREATSWIGKWSTDTCRNPKGVRHFLDRLLKGSWPELEEAT